MKPSCVGTSSALEIASVGALILITILGVGLQVSAEDQRRTSEDRSETTISSTNIPSFTVIGIESRTTNAKEATPEGIIGKQWQKFFREGVLDRIPDWIDRNVYAVYSDYASDHNGEYSFLIGAKVKDGTAAPTGLVAKRVRSGRYAIFTSDKGPVAKVVPSAWQKIFHLEDAGALNRAYQSDFEIYDQRAQNPENGEVDIYIGLK